MKIGILTFIKTANYGAALQAFALQQVILREGHDCEIINYTNDKVVEGHAPRALFKRRGWKNLTVPILYFVYRNRMKKFQEFEKKYCVFSEKCDRHNIKNIAEKYDRIIVGSDQVWNIDITGSDKTYFLDFLNDNKKKYSYAASVGTDYFVAKYQEYEGFISQFEIISVREEETAVKLKNSLGRKDILCDVDPTLLIYDQWKIFVSEKKIHKEYVFMYLTPENKELLDAVKQFANNHNCQVVLLKKGAGIRKGIKIINVASPFDFINYIAYAKYVVTGSFHALCFSIMLGTEFYVTSSKHKNRSGRLLNLLNIFNLQNRIISEPKYYFDSETIDFSNVKNDLSEYAKKSLGTIEMICKK